MVKLIGKLVKYGVIYAYQFQNSKGQTVILNIEDSVALVEREGGENVRTGRRGERRFITGKGINITRDIPTVDPTGKVIEGASSRTPQVPPKPTGPTAYYGTSKEEEDDLFDTDDTIDLRQRMAVISRNRANNFSDIERLVQFILSKTAVGIFSFGEANINGPADLSKQSGVSYNYIKNILKLNYNFRDLYFTHLYSVASAHKEKLLDMTAKIFEQPAYQSYLSQSILQTKADIVEAVKKGEKSLVIVSKDLETQKIIRKKVIDYGVPAVYYSAGRLEINLNPDKMTGKAKRELWDIATREQAVNLAYNKLVAQAVASGHVSLKYKVSKGKVVDTTTFKDFVYSLEQHQIDRLINVGLTKEQAYEYPLTGHRGLNYTYCSKVRDNIDKAVETAIHEAEERFIAGEPTFFVHPFLLPHISRFLSNNKFVESKNGVYSFSSSPVTSRGLLVLFKAGRSSPERGYTSASYWIYNKNQLSKDEIVKIVSHPDIVSVPNAVTRTDGIKVHTVHLEYDSSD